MQNKPLPKAERNCLSAFITFVLETYNTIGERNVGYLEQNEMTGRVIFPDLARAFALFGICVVNVMAFAFVMGDFGSVSDTMSSGDKWALIAVFGLFAAKSYTLFSFMFGVGFAFQIASAERKGVSFNTRYWRRIGGLAFLGFLHIFLFFQGDILVVYAALGSILYLFKDKLPKSLHRWAFWLYALQLLIIGIMSGLFILLNTVLPAEEMAELTNTLSDFTEPATKIYQSGSLLEVGIQRLTEWAMNTGGVFLQGASALAFFLLGLSAVKSGVINDPSAEFWKKSRRVYLPIGLIGSLFAGYLISQSDGLFSARMWQGMFLVFLFAPFSTAGYLGLIAKLSEGKIGPIKTFLARGGTSSLTAYLMQSLILSIIFMGYGFGYINKLSVAHAVLIAAATALFTITFASLWRLRFERGPMEMLLRRWTYAKDEQ